MKNYNELSDNEKKELKGKINKELEKFYQDKNNNNSHNESILEKTALAILEIAITYEIIEEKCLNNSLYVNRIKYHIMDSYLADKITNEILMTFQLYPTALISSVVNAIEEADYEQYDNDYEMEL